MELKVGQVWRDTWSSVDRVISSVGTRPCVQRSPCRSHVGIDDETNGFCAEAFEGGDRLVFVRSAVTAEERPVPAVGQVWRFNGNMEATILERDDVAEGWRIDAEGYFFYDSNFTAGRYEFVSHGSTPEAPKPVEEYPWVLADVYDKPKAPKQTRKPRIRHTYESLAAALRAEEGVPEPKQCRRCHARGPVNEIGHCLGCHGDIDDKLTGAWGTTVAPPRPEPWRPNLDPLFDVPDVGERGS